jgi:hypothetical protein
MAELIRIPRHADRRGALSVIDGILPFPIRRVFFLHHVPPGKERAGHGHRRTRHALVCVAGSCEVRVDGGAAGVQSWFLDDPSHLLVLEPSDWHLLRRFSPGAVLLCLASEPYDPSDVVQEPPR